jgi:RNA polymerase-binding transcription factor DksA
VIDAGERTQAGRARQAPSLPRRGERGGPQLQVDGVTGAFITVALARLERDHVALLAAICELDSMRPGPRSARAAPETPVLREALLTLLRDDLRQTQHALGLAARGVYGFCEICQSALPIRVLLTQPATTRCRDCVGIVEHSRQVH